MPLSANSWFVGATPSHLWAGVLLIANSGGTVSLLFWHVAESDWHHLSIRKEVDWHQYHDDDVPGHDRTDYGWRSRHRTQQPNLHSHICRLKNA